MSEKENEAKAEYQRERYHINSSLNKKLKQSQRDYYDSKMIRKRNINFLYSIKMSKKTLKFDNTEVYKKDFHASRQPVALNLVNVNEILISDKFEHSDKGFK